MGGGGLGEGELHFLALLWSLLQAFCEPGNVTENGVLAFARHVLFPVMGDKGRVHVAVHSIICCNVIAV